METLIITSDNVSTALNELKKGGKHFIITVDVPFPKSITAIGTDSVLSFQGGSFTTNTSSIILLDSCQIFAGAYPIFGQNVRVLGKIDSERSRLSGSDCRKMNLMMHV